MKGYYILALLILLVGCTSTKKVNRQTTQNDVTTSTTATQTAVTNTTITDRVDTLLPGENLTGGAGLDHLLSGDTLRVENEYQIIVVTAGGGKVKAKGTVKPRHVVIERTAETETVTTSRVDIDQVDKTKTTEVKKDIERSFWPVILWGIIILGIIAGAFILLRKFKIL